MTPRQRIERDLGLRPPQPRITWSKIKHWWKTVHAWAFLLTGFALGCFTAGILAALL